MRGLYAYASVRMRDDLKHALQARRADSLRARPAIGEGVYLSLAVQVAVHARLLRAARVRTCCGTFLLYSRGACTVGLRWTANSPRPFQDHDMRPRMAKGRSMDRPAHRLASVTSVRPNRRRAQIARLRRAAITLGPDRVLTCDLSSW
jgi:hypothetical protein